MPARMDPKVADAVFEGGGVKGVGLVGALSVFEEAGYEWRSVGGTSAGAITAALVAAGYSARELKLELDRLLRERGPDGAVGYERFKDKSLLDRVPGIGPALSLGFEKGIYEGRHFEEWLRGLLARKGVRTFADLVNPEREGDEKSSPYRYRLRVVASDVTRRRMLLFPQDVADFEEFDGDPDKLDVARAVRMSMSIPFFFEPVELTARDAAFPRTEEEALREASGRKAAFSDRERTCVIVDGGLLSNFPVDMFDCPPTRAPRWPTFGFKLVAPGEGRPNRITGPVTMIGALVTTMLEAHDQRHMDEEAAVRTVRIRTESVKTTDFSLRAEESDALYDRGRAGAKKFFDRWAAIGGFEGYVEKYRKPVP